MKMQNRSRAFRKHLKQQQQRADVRTALQSLIDAGSVFGSPTIRAALC